MPRKTNSLNEQPKGPRRNKFCCRLPGALARRERRAYRVVCEERATTPADLRAAARKGRDGGRASASLPLLDDFPALPASRRLASARPALAPKCVLFLRGPLESKSRGKNSGQVCLRSW